MIKIYTQLEQGKNWLDRYRHRQAIFACVLGFSDTGLIPGISAAGATPDDRKYTCLADAEFLYNGPQIQPQYPLPPLDAGASPVLISRAVVESLNIPLFLFNAGLLLPPTVPTIDLGGTAAKCVSSGNALPLSTVKHLFDRGLFWGQELAAKTQGGYVILGECVVGGTTTALAVLMDLGIDAAGKVNSSHPTCNHAQKLAVVEEGRRKKEEGRRMKDEGRKMKDEGRRMKDEGRKMKENEGMIDDEIEEGRRMKEEGRKMKENEGMIDDEIGNKKISHSSIFPFSSDPLEVVAAVGDPMQIVVAGMAIAASRSCGVMLAGGTQMLAVYAVSEAIAKTYSLQWHPEQIVVGTTRWVAEDPTGDTVGLAQIIGSVPMIATQLSFATSRYTQLRAYEEGYVKEGVGAGGCAIAAHLIDNWSQIQLQEAIENLADRLTVNS
ncbi:TIGR00303 family protein [Oscillatoriales cyanobacterium USR001]|nr:TIGR00303 family protein [Oscillatoriales cyanobacterium USR001]